MATGVVASLLLVILVAVLTQTSQAHPEGTETENTQTESTQTEAEDTPTENVETESTETEGTQTESTETDNAQTDDVEAENAQTDDVETEAESTETDDDRGTAMIDDVEQIEADVVVSASADVEVEGYWYFVWNYDDKVFVEQTEPYHRVSEGEHITIANHEIGRYSVIVIGWLGTQWTQWSDWYDYKVREYVVRKRKRRSTITPPPTYTPAPPPPAQSTQPPVPPPPPPVNTPPPPLRDPSQNYLPAPVLRYTVVQSNNPRIVIRWDRIERATDYDVYWCLVPVGEKHCPKSPTHERYKDNRHRTTTLVYIKDDFIAGRKYNFEVHSLLHTTVDGITTLTQAGGKSIYIDT